MSKELHIISSDEPDGHFVRNGIDVFVHPVDQVPDTLRVAADPGLRFPEPKPPYGTRIVVAGLGDLAAVLADQLTETAQDLPMQLLTPVPLRSTSPVVDDVVRSLEDAPIDHAIVVVRTVEEQ